MYKVTPDPNYGFKVVDTSSGRHLACARTREQAQKIADEYATKAEAAARNAQTPLTREWAIAQLVERDVAKWGEQEREASRQMRGRLSHGRALNTLAHYDVDNVDHELAREARRVMTARDRRDLNEGG